WLSSNPLVASIDEDGQVLGLSEGITTITANLFGLTTSIEVKVTDYNLNSSVLEDNLVNLVRTRKDSVLGVSNYKLDDDGDLIRSSLGSGFVYKVEFVLKN